MVQNSAPILVQNYMPITSRKHRLTEPSFYAWRREIAARDGTPIAQPTHPKPAAVTRRNSTSSRTPRSAHRTTNSTSPPSFVALRVVPDTPLELVLRCGQVLRIPPGYDANHLRTVVVALETQPC